MPMEFESMRSVHYQPQAIEAMAVTEDAQLLAVVREQNCIEIWLRHSWVQLSVIAGNKHAAIRNIHWLEKAPTEQSPNPLAGRRLVSTGLNGVVIEWDLLQGCVKNKLSVNAPIWQSAMPKGGSRVYLACEDGSIKLVKVKKASIQFERQGTMRAESKCLSLEVTADQRFEFGGYEDSSIRKWNLETLHCELQFVKQTKKRVQDRVDS